MAVSVKGEVPLALSDGRELVLCMDFAMRCKVEDLCGKPFHKVAEDAEAGFQRAIRDLLWGALQRSHPEMSLDDVTELISAHEHEMNDALSRAADAAAGKVEGEQVGNAPRRRTGKSSGGSGAKSG